MTNAVKKPKAKRVLKEITFDHDNAHLALCSASQGSANNRGTALVLKGANFSPESVEKMQAVKVTMSTPEFLRRFFSLWYDDAEVLAAMMGYKEEVETPEMEVQDWVQERLQAFEIIKSLHESPDLEQALAALNEQQYLAFLMDQEIIEKAIKESESVNAEDGNSTIASVENKVEAPASDVKLTKGKTMPKAQVASDVDTSVELVEKSKFDALESASVELQKSLDAQKVELQKAMETIAAFEAEKKQAVIKSKQSAVSAVVKDEKQAAVISKAALLIEDQAEFDSFVSVIKAMQEQVEKSALFQEQGASLEGTEQVQESAVARILKAQYTK